MKEATSEISLLMWEKIRKENRHLLTQQEEPEMRHCAISQLEHGPSCQIYLQRQGLNPRGSEVGIKGCPSRDRRDPPRNADPELL